jgi:hypothetical protein
MQESSVQLLWTVQANSIAAKMSARIIGHSVCPRQGVSCDGPAQSQKAAMICLDGWLSKYRQWYKSSSHRAMEFAL